MMTHRRLAVAFLTALPSAAAFTIRPHATRALPSSPPILLHAAPKAWVTEGLTDQIEVASLTEAGQGDAMPRAGLRLGRVHVVCAGLPAPEVALAAAGCDGVVRLGNSANGWGTGCHPTTRLCVEFLSAQLVGGETVLDYGTGSGVLAIAALRLGASYVTAVDVDAEALVTAAQNCALNDHLDERVEFLHVREVVPGALAPVDVAVANILVGQLVRPSMVAALCANLSPGGLLCLSGIRPDEVPSLKHAYGGWLDWEESMYAEASPGEEGKHYWGRWSRLVGRRRAGGTGALLEQLSELAVS